MITKLKLEAEPLFVTICYINHHLKRHPEIIEKAIADLNIKELTGWNLSVENIEATISLLDFFVEFPEYKFSELITKEVYNEITSNTLAKLRNEYLEVSNNRLNTEEREMIFQGVKKFFDDSEYNIIPYYNRFTATQHDRIAYHTLTQGLFVLGLAALVQAIKKAFDEQKKIHNADATYSAPKNNLELHTRTSIDELSMFGYKPGEIEEVVDITIPEKLDSDATILNNTKEKGIWALFGPPEKAELKDKALEKYYMDSIFEELKSIMPTLSAHRLYILCGYVSWGFGIIKEDEYKKSRYTTLNEFFTNKIKGILKKI